MTASSHPITHAQLDDLIRRAIEFRGQDRRSQTGKLIPGQQAKDILITLSPDLMRMAATGDFVVPREAYGVPVLISEKPGRINRPTNRYMCSVMVEGVDRRGRTGYSFLAEEAS